MSKADSVCHDKDGPCVGEIEESTRTCHGTEEVENDVDKERRRRSLLVGAAE